MQLISADPRSLKENPDKLRQSKSTPQSDALSAHPSGRLASCSRDCGDGWAEGFTDAAPTGDCSRADCFERGVTKIFWTKKGAVVPPPDSKMMPLNEGELLRLVDSIWIEQRHQCENATDRANSCKDVEVPLWRKAATQYSTTDRRPDHAADAADPK